MVKSWKKVPLATSVRIRTLHQDFGMRICQIKEKFPNIPTRTVSYHAKLSVTDETVDRRKNNKGQPRKLSARDCRKLRKTVLNLRQQGNPNFTVPMLQRDSGLLGKCCERTINRELRNMNLKYLNTRQKGLMSNEDHKIRLAFARKCIKRFGDELWVSRVTMYYDGVAFYHKVNPYSQALAPKRKVWRTRGEGLVVTSKGKKEGNGGKCVRLFVAISYGKGVVMCEQWDPQLIFNGSNYKEFVNLHMPNTIAQSNNARNKLILQDGCPVQKSRQANLAYSCIGCKIFSIPARSPDLNPIENFFHLVR